MVKKKPEPRREAKGMPVDDYALDVLRWTCIGSHRPALIPGGDDIVIVRKIKPKARKKKAKKKARRPAAKLPVCKACGQRHKPNTSGTTPDGKWIRERRYCPAKLYRTRPAAKRSAKR